MYRNSNFLPRFGGGNYRKPSINSIKSSKGIIANIKQATQ